ncbi:hypothetical protein NFI96_004432 [Prochilodus magdalenae]|nr:hypothetical protein NFI96_004432 [Prochilodus magdalenae]
MATVLCNCKVFQQVVKNAQGILGTQPPTTVIIWHKHCLGKLRNIIKDISHPNHRRFTLLPSGKSSVGYTVMGKTADLTVVQKTTTDTLGKEGKTEKVIGKEAGCSQSSVSKHINRKARGRKRCGSKKCTSNRDIRTLEKSVEPNPFKNVGEIHKEWTAAGVKPLLNKRQHQKRLAWAKDKKDWTAAEWSKVLFSDESTFCISFGNQGPRVSVKRGEAQKARCLRSSVKFPQSVMVWGAMSSAGIGPLCFLRSKVNAAIYQEVLEHFMLPAADQRYGDADFIFQQDLHTVPKLPVPGLSSVGYTIMGKTADLTVVQKTTTDTLDKEGKTQKIIGKEAGCSQSSVSKHINREARGRKRCGSKKCTSNRDNRTLERSVEPNPFKNVGEIHKEWTAAGVSASRSTMHRRMQDTGFSCPIPCVKPLLNKRQRQKRLAWAKDKKDWTAAEWSKVLFSDESKFCIFFGNQGPRVWRKRGEVNAAVYQEVLEHFMLPAANQLYGDADFIFQQDLHTVPKLPVSGIRTMLSGVPYRLPLYKGRGTLEHILSSCPAALRGGRYRWRHDQVLRTVAETISTAVANNKHTRSQRTVPFVKAGEKPQAQSTAAASLLSSAPDWELRVDLGRQLKFPEYVTSTTLRPDVVLTSVSSKQVLLVELTVPWEDRMEEGNERKRLKYDELVGDCRRKGWKARCEPIEVGCRGFAARSLCKIYTLLGITGAAKRKAIKSTTEAAERASRWIWIKRSEAWAIATGTQVGV